VRPVGFKEKKKVVRGENYMQLLDTRKINLRLNWRWAR